MQLPAHSPATLFQDQAPQSTSCITMDQWGLPPTDPNQTTTPNPPPTAPDASSPSGSKYVPQFSAATEMILKRINSGAGTSGLSSLGITPTGYEDMRRNVISGMKTSANMDLPATPAKVGGRPAAGSNKRASVGSSGSANAPRSTAAGTPPVNSSRPNNGTPSNMGAKGKKPRTKAGTKRKRAKESSDEDISDSEGSMSKLGDEDSDSDVSEDMSSFPKVTQSGRQIVKPTQFVPEVKEPSTRKRGPSRKAMEQTLCKRCGRGHSPSNNQIVFCDGCNAGWHQMCHDPPVSDEAVQDESAAWFCLECSKKKEAKAKSVSAKSSRNASANPSANVSANPSVTSEPPPLISWEDRSLEDKRAYISQLQGPSLVNMLLRACEIHPNLPIFPSVLHTRQIAGPPPHFSSQTTQFTGFGFAPPQNQYAISQGLSSQSRPNSQTPAPAQYSTPLSAGLFSRVEANPEATVNFIRPVPNQPSAASKGKNKALTNDYHHVSPAPSTLVVQEDKGSRASRESTPASPPYPKAGNGLMSKLPPDEEDSEWLVDDTDYGAFSHSVFEHLETY